MNSAEPARKISVPLAVAGAIGVLVLIALGVYLSRPAQKPAEQPASPEANAYVKNLELSDVQMKASENFMKQQVVEIDGKITNRGPRQIDSIVVSCYFYGVDGRMIHRERVPVVRSHGTVLKPGETRSFRLPFDSLPEGWNQAMPRLVIAQITFVQ